MEKRTIPASELVLTNDSRIYHLHLKPGDIGDTIFLVGDPGRVELMSALFDEVELRVGNREFVTHTGIYNSKRISVISTGIGTDNIDIVMNELDALANIDLKTRIIHDELKSLDIIRLGTSGALHEEIDPGSIIVSEVAGGLDNLMYYYESFPEVTDFLISEAFRKHMVWNPANSVPYFVHASDRLLSKMRSASYYSGITLAAPGFYAPQGRSLRSRIYDKAYIEKVCSFRHGSYRINNFEMEGSALYGLSKTLGHHALTVCIALANRVTGKFITDYQSYVRQLLEETLRSVLKDD
jgi:uridine phosphorylase